MRRRRKFAGDRELFTKVVQGIPDGIYEAESFLDPDGPGELRLYECHVLTVERQEVPSERMGKLPLAALEATLGAGLQPGGGTGAFCRNAPRCRCWDR